MMTHEDIYSIVASTLNETFGVPLTSITRETKLFEDLDLDSIDAVDLIVKLQNYTDRKIDPEVFKQVRTVGDVVDAIHTLMSGSDGQKA
jgi:acyl carrier protein